MLLTVTLKSINIESEPNIDPAEPKAANQNNAIAETRRGGRLDAD
jgi:hypothetical protein